MTATSSGLADQLVSAGNGLDYAYRDTARLGAAGAAAALPRGNLDNWDPALIDALAATRRA